MNKKLLTTLLLCIFTFEPLCLAEEVIIGADGQARYSNQQMQVENKKDIRMDNQTNQNLKLTNNQGLNRNIEQITTEKIDELTKFYQKKNLQLINKEKKKRPLDDFPQKTDWKQISDTTYKIPLLDGDYVLWNSTVPYIKGNNSEHIRYATEYDKNNACKGFIKMVEYDALTIAFYEYRIDINAKKNLKLTHIMLMYGGSMSKDAFVYTVDGELRSCLVDDKLYYVNLPIVPSVSTIDYHEVVKSTQTKNNKTYKKNTASPLKTVGRVVSAPFEDAMMFLEIIAFGIFVRNIK